MPLPHMTTPPPSTAPAGAADDNKDGAGPAGGVPVAATQVRENERLPAGAWLAVVTLWHDQRWSKGKRRGIAHAHNPPPVQPSTQAVLTPSAGTIPPGTPAIVGPDFSRATALTVDDLMAAFATTGFQATHLAAAATEINRMLAWRASDDPVYAAAAVEAGLDPTTVDCKIFLAFTSNLGSSGVREIITYLLSRSLVDVVVTTAGAVEEDLIKCLAPTYVGDFGLAGAALRAQGLNRIGNMLVPNSNYCAFEDWVMPHLDAALEDQPSREHPWTPSTLIEALGRAMDDDTSFCTQAARHSIPIFCPALTDGSLGDMLYFHSYKRAGSDPRHCARRARCERFRPQSVPPRHRRHRAGGRPAQTPRVQRQPDAQWSRLCGVCVDCARV